MIEIETLAKGAALTAETWADFVARLHHDCIGEGVKDHYTADAVFIVEKRVERVVPDGYGGRAVIFDGCESSESPEDFFTDCCDKTKEKLNAECGGDFLSADDYDKASALEKHLPDCSLIYVEDRWEFVNQHFTKAAAEAFIRRKKHDYRGGLRVYVDCSCYSWELNTIKAAILSGCIGFIPEAQRGQAKEGGS